VGQRANGTKVSNKMLGGSGPNPNLNPTLLVAPIYPNLKMANNVPPQNRKKTRMWANAQRDGRPAEHRWRPLFNAVKFS